MSIDWIRHGGVDILYLNLEGVIDPAEKLGHLHRLNALVGDSEGGILVLINLTDFMPGPGFMEFATESLKDRAHQVAKAAYVGIGNRNRRLFDYYDAFNSMVVDRKTFKSVEQALRWLAGSSASMPSENA